MAENAIRISEKRMNDGDKALPVSHIELTASIVSAYVSNNHIQTADLTTLISSVHAALGGLGTSAEPAEPEIEKPTPAQIRKSITPGGLISFIDGKSYKTLKRHLTGHGLDPSSYRQRFGLPADYPMVAASYSEQRSSLAKALGLGKAGAAAKVEVTAPASDEASATPKGRGRGRKAATV